MKLRCPGFATLRPATRPVSSMTARVLSTCLLGLALFAGRTASAQAALTAQGGVAPSRIDITGQYGYFSPFNSDINNYPYQSLTPGFVGSIAGYYNKYLGLQIEGSAFPQSGDNDCAYTAQAGPILRYPKVRFMPFFHALGGASKVGGPVYQPCSVWGWGVTGGFGLDYVLPYFHNRIAVRPAQGDFQYQQIDNGPLVLPAGVNGGLGEVWNYRVSAGMTLRLGSVGAAGLHGEPTLTCSTDPASAFPGDPVTVTSLVVNLHPTRTTMYVWTTSGGKVAGSEATEPIDTAGLAPGTYEVSGKIVDGRRMREVASCTTSFTVRNYDPPTLTCSANRAAINSGDPVTITSAGVSPQNRPLTYSYSASNGQVTGNGNTAALSTAGATPGTITVTCKVTDDRDQSATATASVVIATPAPPAAAPATSELCSLSFERDRRRPDRVDNEAKGCLDEVALTLNRDAAARLVVIGHHGAGETNRDSASRAMNAADYLMKEKGIDRGRLDLRIAADPTRTVNLMMVPAGGSLEAIPGSNFDPASVVRHGEAYGTHGQHAATPKRKKHRHRKAAATAAQP